LALNSPEGCKVHTLDLPPGTEPVLRTGGTDSIHIGLNKERKRYVWEGTDADRAANVVSDQIVLLGQSSKTADRPNHPMRLVVVKIKPHVSKGKYKGGSTGVDSDGFLRIADQDWRRCVGEIGIGLEVTQTNLRVFRCAEKVDSVGAPFPDA